MPVHTRSNRSTTSNTIPQLSLHRAFSQEDYYACSHIWLLASLAGHDFIPSQFWQAHQTVMEEQYLPHSSVTIASFNTVPAAFIAVQQETLAALFTLPAYWGQGLGSTLLKHIFSSHTRLELTVYEKNNRAVTFYHRAGFIPLQKQICGHTGEVELLMEWTKARHG